MPETQMIPSPLPQFAEIALPLPLRQTFTYRIPTGIQDVIALGARVLVPFGNRTVTGYAVAVSTELDAGLGLEIESIKDLSALVDESPLITDEILRLAKWTADYYAASWGEVLKASLPAGINSATENVVSITEAGRHELLTLKNLKSVRNQLLKRLADENIEIRQRDLEKELGDARVRRAVRELANAGFAKVRSTVVVNKVKPKVRKAVRLTGNEPEKPLTETQQKTLDTLTTAGGEMMFTDLAERSAASSINTLAKRGLVEVFISEVRRDPLAGDANATLNAITLNDEQAGVLQNLTDAITDSKYSAFLLHGVTGSGKTEVYMRAMRNALDGGKSSLMLVPEIALTPIFSRRLRAIFGDEVAILHSNLSPGERFDEWRRIRSGAARIVIGTRSAVFAPLDNIGLIIVDEEHDTSYRQNESPFYNARDVAVMRANQAHAVIVLGSATPSLESFHNSHSGKYTYLRLPNRIGNRPLAKAELIDMREVFQAAGKDIIISPQLEAAIRDTHRKGEQSIVLLNRRGFSAFVLCRTCGESLRCKNCDITLTYHKFDRKITCHYCNYSVAVPKVCPFCESEFLYFIGEGTEQLEERLAKLFPDLRIARIDRDTMAKKGEMSKTLHAFDRGSIDMLVGTQMLAKGHDFHNVTLVGVISVDTGLGLPDFRSAERTFQLLTQVAGRAGRGSLPGRVLIQTYYPEHYALRHAVEQDYDAFYKDEIKFRQRMSYPPFVVLASILIKHTDEAYAKQNAEILRSALDAANTDKSCRILGPAPASISRLKGEYRFQILIKSVSRKSLRNALDIATAEAELRGADLRTIFAEIDPVNLM